MVPGGGIADLPLVEALFWSSKSSYALFPRRPDQLKYASIRLLNRSSRGFSITEIGREYYDRYVAMLVQAEAADRVIEEVRAEPRGVVRMSCPTGLLSFRFSGLIARLMAENLAIAFACRRGSRPILSCGGWMKAPKRLVAAQSLVPGALRSPADLNGLLSLDFAPARRDHR